ncbi:MAG: hypothetical protein ACOVOR_04900 [Rhabdochlamydiaceae bacterium]
MSLFEQLPSVSFLDCFDVKIDIPYSHSFEDKRMKKSSFKSLQPYMKRESSFDLSIGWNEEGLFIVLEDQEDHIRASWPDYRTADAFELFIDTRNLKSAGFIHRFCHHFVCLPVPVEGIQFCEVTQFRSEDSHELSDLVEAELKVLKQKKGYKMLIHLPRTCLHGYDPSSMHQLGFAYRLNKTGKDSESFPLCSENYAIEKHPSLWATLDLKS